MKETFIKAVKEYFKPLKWFVAMIFLVEEAIWNLGASMMERLGAVIIIAYIESFIRKLPPYPAFAAFLIPDLLIIPTKIVCFDLIAKGYVFWGVTAFIIAKILGMALFARIFNLTKPQLMTIGWFAKLHARISAYSDKIHAKLNAWPPYQELKAKVAELKLTLKELFN